MNDMIFPFPHFILVGMMKCGTTSLARALSIHPEVHFSTPKEPRFFSDDDAYEKGFEHYRRVFGSDAECNGKKVGEGSVNYSHAPEIEKSCARITLNLPEVKIILMVRDPLEQIKSAWNYRHLIHGYPGENLLSACIHKNPIYIKNARYIEVLATLRRHFAPERIRVLFMEDLRTSFRETIQQACEFIGVDPTRQPAEQIHANKTTDIRRPRFLTQALKSVPGVQRLYAHLPRGLRLAFGRIIHRGAIKGSAAEFTMENRAFLLDCLRSDSLAFLEEHGKNYNFWSLDY